MENQTPGPETPVTSEPVSQSGTYRPADYYSTPPAEKKGCPKSLAIGCGAIGCLGLLLIVAVGGYFVSHPGKLVEFLVNRIDRQIDQIAASDVTADEKEALRMELRTFSNNVKSGAVEMIKVQPVLQKLNSSIRDGKLTRDEVLDLTESLRDINDSVGSKKGGATVSLDVLGPRASGLEPSSP